MIWGCDRPTSSFISLLEAVEDWSPPASPWFVLRPAPAHACNAVCNEKSKQGTAVRHDRNVFPLEGAPRKKKRRGREKKKREKNKKKRRGRDVSRRSARLGQSGRLMLLYTGCHSASPPSPIGSSSPYQFLPRLPPSLPLPPSLSLCFPQDCVCSGGQWHSCWMSPSRPPPPPPPFLHAWL